MSISTAARAIVEGRHHDPFNYLGWHREGGEPVVRVFLPEASQVEVLDYMSRLEKDSAPLPPPDPAAQQKLVDNIYMPQLVDPVLLGKAKPEDAVAQFRKDATDLLKTS